MKKKSLCLSLFFFSFLTGKTQFIESFSDGDFSLNPVWVGNTGDWIVNNSFQLQSNYSVANSSFYMSTASTLATSVQWEFFLNLAFNTSSANYTDVYIIASASDLLATATTGFFVRIGNTDDDICLYRKDATGIVTKIINGVNGITSTSNNKLKIKIIRDAQGQWTLYRDITGTGTNYLSEGSVIDTVYDSSSYFGILVKQSTASFFQRHFFDDIEVKAYVPDTISPAIKSVVVLSANAADVLFSEPVENVSGGNPANYVGDNNLGAPATAVPDAANNSLVHLLFPNSFTSNTNYQLTINGVKDLAGNSITDGRSNFIYYAPYQPQQYDVVIDEIMADPSPQVSLPGNEWIELRNITSTAINLKGWRIGNVSGQSGPMAEFILLPDSFLILCSGAALTSLSGYGACMAITGFPSLNNTGDLLFLKSPEDKIIHSVNYNEGWYQNELKKSGGWSLEMIDPNNPCSGISNWTASTDIRGGSPGKKNAANAINPDLDAPVLLRAYLRDSISVVLVFSESLDSLKAATPANFTISDGIGIAASALTLSPSFDRVTLKLNKPLVRNKVYTITASTLTDCTGNVIGRKNSARMGLSEVAAATDIVVNELLFNPVPGGVDYVEIYNRSNKIIDLRQTYIANRNSSGVVSDINQLSAESNLLFPEDFMVVTASAAIVKSGYITKNVDAFIEPAAMPSFNDDKGTVIILNAQGVITDELNYDEKWHFKLIDNREGIALERIDYNAATQLPGNWHSAATSAGYGTPTYKNSQYRINDGVQGEVSVSPEIVSPDNDGQDDFATIDYNFPEPGYVANITIFDATGRPVRYLQRNSLCGTKGNFRWDGLGEKNQRLAVGIYVMFTEVFNLKGNRKQFKKAIVLARRT